MDKYYFTNTEYKNNYKSLLKEYLSQHLDNEVNDFNILQIEKYKYGLDFIELIVRPYNFDVMPNYINLELFEELMCHFNIANHNIESYQDFCRCFENNDFEFSLDIVFDNKYDYLIKSWNKIINFLNETFKLISSNSEPEAIELSNTTQIENIYLGQPTKAKDYKNFIWFKTGIPLATGEAFDLYRKYKKDKGHFTKICLELGFKDSDRTYFSSTINDNVTDKNTFTDKDKLQKLHKHLTENNMNFGTEFLKKHKEIEPD